MKIRLSKLRQLIREFIEENWQDDADKKRDEIFRDMAGPPVTDDDAKPAEDHQSDIFRRIFGLDGAPEGSREEIAAAGLEDPDEEIAW